MAKMFKPFFFKSLFFFWYRFLLRQLKSLAGFPRTVSNNTFKFQKFSYLAHRSDLHDHTLVFDVEASLLKSSSLFPYFALVSFEAGGMFRSIVLVLLYPLVCLVGDEMGIKIMVMICFIGIKAENFRVGRAVLPKFFLENVGSEMFHVLRRGGKKVGVSKLPQVMVESFLKEYLEIDFVVGRELKVFCGYFVGLMEHRNTKHALEQVQEGKGCVHTIGITSFNRISLDHDLFSLCKEIYVVTKCEKRSWEKVEREKYPKALIFHDSRLAVGPTPLEGAAILIWVPFAIILAIFRISLTLSLPYNISTPLLSLTGLSLTGSGSGSIPKTSNNSKGHLYVCNHRTLLDPLYLSFTLQKDLIAVTYSLSRLSEILAPIKTVRLTRNRDEDARMMKELLKEGDLVVCPEGTTCREPYLLRFSPLFSEMCDEITAVAMNCEVSMFHGTTAGGFKWLDPVFFLMNPSPSYSVRLLEKVACGSCFGDEESSRFRVANEVQMKIGKALGFECTTLTRKDKYLMLAGNEGIVSSSTGPAATNKNDTNKDSVLVVNS